MSRSDPFYDFSERTNNVKMMNLDALYLALVFLSLPIAFLVAVVQF